MNGMIWWRIRERASNLVQKLIALKFKQKVLIFRKICTPKFLGCYTSRPIARASASQHSATGCRGEKVRKEKGCG
jgi:hypothetical protein